ncbi:hypothetical protein DKX38_023677 [Salix brachista]|uniref:Uncharacterized protein n=1 Tax=Salix brachista TaxID=2182728 RepID=A0A5N5JJG2_9ROSI|nr:hypothetical protein DKX38_023677 [Salix brachista]
MRLVTEDENNQPLSPKIPKVPHKLRNENEECYRPLVVSIGPYHYPERDTTLREVETLKVPMARQFILDGGKDIELIYSELEKVIQTAREFYNEIDITGFDDEQFARMMFLDGCFILQFISCVTHNYENLEMSDQQVVGVKRDLLLLENQVPFPVLQSLMRLRYEKNETDHGLKLLNDFLFHQILKPRDQPLWTRRLLWPGMLIITIFSYVFFVNPVLFFLILIATFIALSLLGWLLILTGKKRKASASGYDRQCQPAQQPAHLLELLHSLFICSHKSKVNSLPRRYGHCLSYLVTCCKEIIPAKPETVVARESRGHYLYSSAKNLKKVGIHFMPSQTSGLMDVKFKPSFFYGIVKLPTLTIDVLTMPLLLNLVAYEKSTALDQLPVTSYICFMDSLIDDADDVKELRSNGIIVNFHGSDQQVADLFNNMGSSLEPDNSAYNDVKREINRQYESTLKKWVDEMQQTYFRSPWAFLAFAAAAVGLALTATQINKGNNQIQVPFQVIWSLMDLRFGKGEAGGGNTLIDDYIRHIRALPPRQESFKEMRKKFVGKCIWKQPQMWGNEEIEDHQPAHLLELLYTDHINKEACSNCSRRSSDWYSYRSAKDLRTVGIRFRPNCTNAYSDVEFQSSVRGGKLILPPITIEESFKSVLLNLIAYETCCHASGELWVTSYACFLDSLIQDVEDVKVLQSQGVLNIFVRVNRRLLISSIRCLGTWCPTLTLIVM